MKIILSLLLSGLLSPCFAQYAGMEHDADNIKCARYRSYDPEVGAFISKDALGIDAGINFYAYAEINPINKIDPLGLDDIVIVGVNAVYDDGQWGSNAWPAYHMYVALRDDAGNIVYASRAGPGIGERW